MSKETAQEKYYEGFSESEIEEMARRKKSPWGAELVRQLNYNVSHPEEVEKFQQERRRQIEEMHQRDREEEVQLRHLKLFEQARDSVQSEPLDPLDGVLEKLSELALRQELELEQLIHQAWMAGFAAGAEDEAQRMKRAKLEERKQEAEEELP